MYKISILILLLNLSLFTSELEKVSLQFHWLDQFEFAGYYIAKEKGYYREAGFDVEFLNYRHGLNISDDVEKQKVTFGIGGSDLIIDLSRGRKFILLASIFQSSPLVLLTTPNSNIKSIKDFKNRTIMLTPDVYSSVTFNAMMRRERITLEDMKIVEHSFNINDLIDGKVDLFQAYLSNEPFILREKEVDPIIFDPKDYGFDLYNDILFTSEEYYQANPERVKAFRDASLKGWKYAFNHIEETVDIMLQKYNVQNRSKEALLYEAKITKKLSLLDGIPLGDINKIKLQRIYDILNLMNLTEGLIDIDNILINQNPKLHLTEKEREFIKKHPTVTIASTTDSAPMLLKNSDGTFSGIDIEIGNIIYQKTGLKIEFKDFNWEEAVNKAINYEVDGLSSSVYNKEREDRFNFSSSYLKSTPKVFVKKGNPKNITSFKDLKNKIVAVRKGTQAIKTFAKKFGSDIYFVDNSIEMIKSLINGKADYILFFDNIEFIVNREGIDYIDVAFTLPKASEIRFSLRKDWSELNTIISKAIDSIPEHQKVEIRQKWFGYYDKKVEFNMKEQNYIDKKETIKVCVNSNLSPIEYINNRGEHKGVTADILKLIHQNSDLNFEIVQTESQQDTLLKVQNRECDALYSVNENSIYRNYMNFSYPYLKFPFVVATNSEQSFINNINILGGEKIAIIKDYLQSEKIKLKYPKINFIEVNNIQDGLQLVRNKEVFGYIDTLPSISYLLRNDGITDIRVTGKLDEELQLSIASRDDEPTLHEIMKKSLESITKSQIDQIVNRWLAIKFEERVNFQYLYEVIALFLLLVLILYLEYNRIRKVNRLINKKNVELENAYRNLEKFVDAQNYIVILADSKHIKFANKKFFDFFELKNLDNFSNNSKCICDYFIKNDRYFHLGKIEENQSWIEALQNLSDSERVVSMKDREKNLYTFSVSLNQYDENTMIVSFADISETMMKHIDLQNKTIHDKLTGAHNREFFEINSKRFIKECQLDNSKLAIAFLDIDHFKSVNDTYGHDVGDEVLIQFVKTVINHSRKDDILIRWGGEEFVLILKVNSAQILYKVLENLRKVIENHKFSTVGQKTCSIGGSIYKQHEDIMQTIKRADEAVYIAKSSGRNRVVIKD